MMNVPIFVQRQANGVVVDDVGNIDVVAPFELMLGRNPACDLRLDSNEVSRRHARVSLGPEGYVIEDLSNNGTLTYTGDVLCRDLGAFPYGTHFTIGPFRVTVGRPGQSERPMPIAAEATPPLGTPMKGTPMYGSAHAPSPMPTVPMAMPTVPMAMPMMRPASPANGIPSTPPPATFQSPPGFLAIAPPPAHVAMTPQDVARARANELKHSEELINLRRRVHAELLKNLDFAKIDPTVVDPSLRPRVLTALKRIVAAQSSPLLEQLDRDSFIGELLDEALGLGPLEPLLADASITEIMVVDPATIYVERGGCLE
ncbi:MAG: Type secretion system hydrolase TadA/VirB11/CpaF, TadA subfamily protein, partial [Labilithrix sp.]|nr:Type secretion system hydrolase TadA/VirB11/CpaF, TadA subfamily protein [Labilithrix sp.]